MTKERKLEIAILVMKVRLKAAGLVKGWNPETPEPSFPSLLLRKKLRKKVVSDSWSIGWSTDAMQKSANFMVMISDPAMLVSSATTQDLRLAYEWLMYEYSTTPISINNTFRREAGNIAKLIGVSEAQIIEFFRLLLIDVVNLQLQELKNSVPLFEKQG